jgi:hypothetical protein
MLSQVGHKRLYALMVPGFSGSWLRESSCADLKEIVAEKVSR